MRKRSMTNEEKFFKLWEYLSSHDVYKREAWKTLKLGADPGRVACPACTVAQAHRRAVWGVHFFNLSMEVHGTTRVNVCDYCPVRWPQGLNCRSENGLYNRWLDATTETERFFLAREISLLPWV